MRVKPTKTMSAKMPISCAIVNRLPNRTCVTSSSERQEPPSKAITAYLLREQADLCSQSKPFALQFDTLSLEAEKSLSNTLLLFAALQCRVSTCMLKRVDESARTESSMSCNRRSTLPNASFSIMLCASIKCIEIV